MEPTNIKSNAKEENRELQKNLFKESADKVFDKYNSGDEILFNEKAPDYLRGHKAYFQGVNKDNGSISIQLLEPTRVNGPTQITLTHGYNSFNIHDLANDCGIFEKS